LTGKEGAVAACFAAAWNYYYGDIEGLNRPHQNKLFSVKLDYHILDREFNNIGSAYHTVVPWFEQRITVFLRSSHTHTFCPSIELFSNTTHETAHNAHYQHFKTRYTWVSRGKEWKDYIDNIVQESFAAGVEWRLMNKRYGTRERYYDYFDNYTGIFEDLFDVNTGYARRAYLGQNLDRVQGLTALQFETAVFESFTFDELRDKIKSKYPSASSAGLSYTVTDIDNLFKYWWEI
jgi:hypothetical protein